MQKVLFLHAFVGSSILWIIEFLLYKIFIIFGYTTEHALIGVLIGFPLVIYAIVMAYQRDEKEGEQND